MGDSASQVLVGSGSQPALCPPMREMHPLLIQPGAYRNFTYIRGCKLVFGAMEW